MEILLVRFYLSETGAQTSNLLDLMTREKHIKDSDPSTSQVHALFLSYESKYPLSIVIFLLLFYERGLFMQPRLTCNSLCSPGLS
jgi:hypothetical protein